MSDLCQIRWTLFFKIKLEHFGKIIKKKKKYKFTIEIIDREEFVGQNSIKKIFKIRLK